MIISKTKEVNPLIKIETNNKTLEMTINLSVTLTWRASSDGTNPTIIFIKKEDEVYPLFYKYYHDIKEGKIFIPYNSNIDKDYIDTLNEEQRIHGINMNAIHLNYVHLISDCETEALYDRDAVDITENKDGLYIFFSGMKNKPYYEVEFKSNDSMYKELNVPLFRLYMSLINYINDKPKKLERKK